MWLLRLVFSFFPVELYDTTVVVLRQDAPVYVSHAVLRFEALWRAHHRHTLRCWCLRFFYSFFMSFVLPAALLVVEGYQRRSWLGGYPMRGEG